MTRPALRAARRGDRRLPASFESDYPDGLPAGAPADLLHQSHEAEVAVIGSVLIDPEALRDVGWLPVEAFYRRMHQQVWQCIQQLRERREAVDLITVPNELDRMGWLYGGRAAADAGRDLLAVSAAEVSGFANQVPTSAHALHYAHIVERLWALRRVEALAGELVTLTRDPAFNADPAALRVEAMRRLRAATTTRRDARGGLRDFSAVMADALADIEARVEEGVAHRVLRSGIPEWDDAISPVEPGEYIVLAARTRMGKSAIGQTLADNWARQLKPRGQALLYLTLEMPAEQQARRWLARYARLDQRDLRAGFRDRDGRPDDAKLARAVEWVGKLSEQHAGTVLFWERALTVDDLDELVGELVETHRLGAVLVDQGDLFADDPGAEEQERIGYASRRLLQIAKGHGVALLSLAQLNRAAEAGGEARPTLAMLRYSGRLEMDADRVWFLHRPAVFEPHPEDEAWTRYAELLVAKDRDGVSPATVALDFDGARSTITGWPAARDLPARLAAAADDDYAPRRRRRPARGGGAAGDGEGAGRRTPYADD